MFMFVTGVPGAISAGFLLDKLKKFKIIGLITSILGTYEHKGARPLASRKICLVGSWPEDFSI